MAKSFSSEKPEPKPIISSILICLYSSGIFDFSITLILLLLNLFTFSSIVSVLLYSNFDLTASLI
ncbi:MAG: hypothetical protein LBM96_04560 [Methanobrevibacter sp.]|jgi:hypothetical protein|nr:hypothetical protein [Candidatus Methanoflexus mossambicus]